MKIIQSRLEGVSGDVVDPDAVQFASRKVAAVSGDARRALDICRRAVEIAENESHDDDETLPPTPSKTGRNNAGQNQPEGQKVSKVTISTVKQAINEATTSPLQQYLRCLPLISKVFLAALLARVRRTGIGESVLGDVVEEAKRIGTMANCASIQKVLLADADRCLREGGMQSKQEVSQFTRILGVSNAAVELMEAGVLGLEARKGERTGKVRLNVGEDEIKLALKDDVEVRDLGFAN